MTTRSIGFIDHQLDNYHANVFLDLLRGDLKARGWVVARCWGMDAKGGKKWAAEKGVSYVENVSGMRDCDALMILAPSNPEVHFPMAKLALPLGLPTYIDKTFTQDHPTAKKIFALADRRRVPVITASALRCCASLDKAVKELGKKRIRHMRTWGPGRSFEEYAIHPMEMVISVMGPEVRKVMWLKHGNDHQIQMEFSGGRTATVFLHIGSQCAYQAMLTNNEKTIHVNCSADPIFRDLCDFILDFFEAGKETIDRRESLAIRKILDVASDKRAQGKFIRV